MPQNRDDIAQITVVLRDAMKAGDKDALRHLPYLIGPQPKELTITGDRDAPLVVEIEYVRSESDPGHTP